jgi:hypothetical protein
MDTFTRTTVGAFAAVAMLALVACGDDGDDAVNASGTGPLSDLCPSTVVVQTDWNPEAEHGGLYELVGDGYQVNKDGLRVTGPLMDGDVDTGVDIEVRAGGPAIGFQQVTAQMYTDSDITLGYVFSDEAIQNSAEQPTLAVLAPLEISPQMIMWDPGTLPNVQNIADLGAAGTTVLYFEGGTYMKYLLGQGVLKESQIDGSYDGYPARWVSEGGRIAQQGYATAEPYIYEFEVPEWRKPVKFQLIYDTGYPVYPSTISILPDRKDELAPCLEKLVPIMQRAEVAYLDDPAKANKLILELVNTYNNGWVYSQGVADFSAQQMADLDIVSNGPDSTLGNFDPTRIQKLIDILKPILAADNAPIADGLTPDDIVTNEFIDTSIGLG